MRVERPNPGNLMDIGQDRTSRKAWIRISPWVIMGSLVVMVPIFIFVTMESIQTQRRNMELMLSEKGGALIRSFEAGTRTGMMGRDWSGARVQRLIMETADLPDIQYILITDRQGRIVAHNQPLNIGRMYGPDLPDRIDKTLRWRIVTTVDGKKVFEVYRRYSPSRGGMLLMPRDLHSRDWFSPHMLPRMAPPPAQVIYIGLDMEPVEKIINESIKQKVILAIILLMYGLLGIVAVVIAQNYLSTKASLSRIKAFSDTLVENMPIGLVVIGENGSIVTLNDVSEKLLRITASQAVGKASREVLPEQITSLVQGVRHPHDIAVRDLRIPIDGKTMAFDASAGMLRDDEGHILGHIVLLRDITEIEHLKREMERKERLASIGSLAAGVAHEIRNPLSSIKGFATYFKERYRGVPEDQRIADIMVGEVERLNRVIGQLLEFARPLDLRIQASSLLDIVSRSLEMIEQQASEKNIRIDRSGLGDGPCPVDVDPDKIAQVLLNLYLNAMEAMQEGGTLAVKTRCDEKTARFAVDVVDTGHGIAQDDLAHIFDPYFTTKQSGTGLGLAIVHKIMEAHGGEIKVQSVPGTGTTVSLTMPSG
ncbi:MAG TPA: ATP-binding protein, partial [Deltaproteobacteria bacterium]|nr:ATP-binding protein [Deltaproteobacteria bacterium]